MLGYACLSLHGGRAAARQARCCFARLLPSPCWLLTRPLCTVTLTPPPQKLNEDLDDYWEKAPKKGDAPAAAAPEAAPEAAAEEEAAAE